MSVKDLITAAVKKFMGESSVPEQARDLSVTLTVACFEQELVRYYVEKDSTNIAFVEYWSKQTADSQLMLIYNKNIPYSLCIGYWQATLQTVYNYEMPSVPGNNPGLAHSVKKLFINAHKAKYGDLFGFDTAIQETITLWSPYAVFVQATNGGEGVIASTDESFIATLEAGISQLHRSERKNNPQDRPIYHVTMNTKGDLSIVSSVTAISSDYLPSDTFYPNLIGAGTDFPNLKAFSNYYFSIPDTLLFFYGPRGTGKSTLSRFLASEIKGEVLVVEDQRVYQSPGFVSMVQEFISEKKQKRMDAALRLKNDKETLASLEAIEEEERTSDVSKKIEMLQNNIDALAEELSAEHNVMLILDDAEIAVTPRENQQSIAGSLLGMADGVVPAGENGLKIVILLNIENLPKNGEKTDNFDSALNREGRCAGAQRLGNLSFDEVNNIIISMGKTPISKETYENKKGNRSGVPLCEIFGLYNGRKQIGQ